VRPALTLRLSPLFVDLMYGEGAGDSRRCEGEGGYRGGGSVRERVKGTVGVKIKINNDMRQIDCV